MIFIMIVTLSVSINIIAKDVKFLLTKTYIKTQNCFISAA